MIQSIEKFISSSDSLFLCLMIYFYGFVAKNILNPDYKCHRKKVRYQIIIHFTRMDKSKQAKPPNSGINRFYRCLMREFWGTIIVTVGKRADLSELSTTPISLIRPRKSTQVRTRSEGILL